MCEKIRINIPIVQGMLAKLRNMMIVLLTKGGKATILRWRMGRSGCGHLLSMLDRVDLRNVGKGKELRTSPALGILMTPAQRDTEHVTAVLHIAGITRHVDFDQSDMNASVAEESWVNQVSCRSERNCNWYRNKVVINMYMAASEV